MSTYVCKVKNTKEVVWRLSATCIENAIIKFAQIKHLSVDEYSKLFHTEEVDE